ncbi:hypothetical protein DYGSA30_06730 [Dyella sp. GSA-30]|nr:hypothetical protein DYGSA30_06730 [Dyella sp. GSA-30]
MRHQIDGQQGADAGWETHDDFAALWSARMAKLLSRDFYLTKDSTAVFQQLPACIGGCDATTVALEEMRAQFDFQLAHLPAEQRLRDVQCSGSAGEAAELNNANKALQVFQIHEYLAARRPL